MRMKPLHLSLLVAAALACAFTLQSVNAAQGSAAGAADIQSTPVKVDRRDPAIDKIIPAGATLERVASGFKWLEGPVWIKGSLYFAEIPSDSIRKWTPGAGVSIFLQPSGYLGPLPYGGPESGSNGMTLDARGRLTAAGHAQRDIFRLESLNAKATRTILADTYQGKRLNSPNDLAYKSDGSLYFSDPPYGLRTQKDTDPEKQLKINGVYRIAHALDHKPGAPPDHAALQLLVSDLPRPNGIAFSPDEKYLYVSNSEPKRFWMRYTVKPDGSLADGKVFYDVSDDKRRGAPDGMKLDANGNIYSAGPGGIWIISPAGKPLGVILVPENTSNVAWGGADRKTLYITATGNIYRIRLNVAGAPMIGGK